MKKFWMLVFFTGAVAIVVVIPVAAQLNVNFHAPAAFYAGNAKFPAGAYNIHQSTVGADNSTLYEITDSSGAHSVMLECMPSPRMPSGAGAEVHFNRYCNADYLKSVLTHTGGSIDCNESTAEKIAAKNGTPESHSVKTK